VCIAAAISTTRADAEAETEGRSDGVRFECSLSASPHRSLPPTTWWMNDVHNKEAIAELVG
jgi:hypothetical protein